MCSKIRGLRSQMAFAGTGNFPEKSGKFPVQSIREHPLPGPDLVPTFGTPYSWSRLRLGNIWEFPNASRIKYDKFNFGARQEFPD